MPSHLQANTRPLNEREAVEIPLLDQLKELGWDIIDLDNTQQPKDSHRTSFTDVVMEPVLRDSLKKINPFLEEDQIDGVVKQITVHQTSNLLEINQKVLKLLLENTSVSENRQTGEKSPTVRFVDYNDPSKNSFVAVCQFKVRILGTEHHIIPDVVCFVNGLPVVVIECKSPRVHEPIPEAIDQLLRYSEQRGAKGEGSAPLFFYNQFVVATCRQSAKFGTITTHIEKFFYRWADPYPMTVEELDHGSGAPNDQQRLVAGMLAHQNLLDLIRTFTLFGTTPEGKTIKMVGRYQQFRAVKLAIKRLLEGESPRERSGTIWHTQGSGKSLTMMFMVREMYRHNTLMAWKVVFVTDRTQLEQQLAETSQSIGYTVKVANSIAQLKDLLKNDTSDLVMAMIQKFQEHDLNQTFPQLNTSPNILIMTDEAHRSQYQLLGSNLDNALPNASRIGYTGTPIERTVHVFGDYIDKYTMRQSIEDGVTLEIVYEGRTHNAEVKDQSGMDAAFQDVFSDYNLSQRLEILGFGSRDAYLEAESTIEAKAKDMVAHYLQHVFPNGYKAQVVATSREAAVRYKTYLDAALQEAIATLEKDNPNQLDVDLLKKLETDVVISGSHNDLPHLHPYTNASRQETTIKRFKLPFGAKEEGIDGNMGFVVVNNMLLTGFDAPVEQVMYLDRVIKAHQLLQAIARVNRVAGSEKEKGYVVDYVGIGHHLKEAINTYDDMDRQEVEDTLSFPEEEVRELEQAHRAIMDLLREYGIEDLTDVDAFFDLFYDEDIRFEFIKAFRQFTKCLNLVYPHREALNYVEDFNILSQINVMSNRHFRDGRMSMKGIPAKLRAITDTFLSSQGISVKVEPISILDDDFHSEVNKRTRSKTKAAEIEHAIRHHLDVELDDDPELQASFYEALQAILDAFAENWEKIYEELEKLRQRIKDVQNEPTYGLHKKKEMPFFRMFKKEIFGDDLIDDDQIGLLVSLTKEVYAHIERELALSDFWSRIPARNQLKAKIQQTLIQPAYMAHVLQNRNTLISRAMEIAEKNTDIIRYAS